jgi:hypothetical protein
VTDSHFAGLTGSQAREKFNAVYRNQIVKAQIV